MSVSLYQLSVPTFERCLTALLTILDKAEAHARARNFDPTNYLGMRLAPDMFPLVRARALSRAVMGNIRQNLWFAFAYNAAGIPLAAGALYPAFGLLLSPAIAAGAMSLSSVSVIGNALRLRGVRL